MGEEKEQTRCPRGTPPLKGGEFFLSIVKLDKNRKSPKEQVFSPLIGYILKSITLHLTLLIYNCIVIL